MTRDLFRVGVVFPSVVFLGAALTGCATTGTKQQGDPSRGYIVYLDGAGGGGLMNYGKGVIPAFRKAGYDGSGEGFKWQTGLGVAADQVADVKYKRDKAREVAQRIQQHKSAHPSAPVNIIGLSAGTAIAVFALEELPETTQVDNVVLLGASISATYDLTNALKRVRNRVYVFTSERDGVLRFLMPGLGSADRVMGVEAAGIRGFVRPNPASEDAKRQYLKVARIQWASEFQCDGDAGDHTSAVQPRFVRSHIAPLVLIGTPESPSQTLATQGTIENPDFQRWAGFPQGSYTEYAIEHSAYGPNESLRAIERLVHEWEDAIYIERQIQVASGAGPAPEVRGFFERARVRPQDHPRTHPSSKLTQKTCEPITLSGSSLECETRVAQCAGDFTDWGTNPHGEVRLCKGIPGQIAEIDLQTSIEGRPIKVRAKATGYRIAQK